jgi:hypothetical protein
MVLSVPLEQLLKPSIKVLSLKSLFMEVSMIGMSIWWMLPKPGRKVIQAQG